MNATAVNQDNNTFRQLSFCFALALIVTVCGVLPELIFYVTHTNTYLLYLVWPPTIVGTLLCGGLKRTFQHRAARYLLGFFLWMMVAVPFSSWRGASFGRVQAYTELAMPMLIVFAGLAISWKEVRALFYAIAFSGLFSLLCARLFADVENGRLTMMASGSIGNSNDLAQHLVMMLPFVLFLVLSGKMNVAFRWLLFMPPILYGVWVIIGTASRGGVLALLAMFLFVLWRGSAVQRMLILAVAGILTVAVPVLFSDNVRTRLKTMLGEEHEEAKESEASRAYLFRQSVIYTLQHPIVGVGPDQFGNYEGKQSVSQGKLGNWHATHCSWTQVSSECGIPGLIFLFLGIGSAWSAVNRVYRQAREQGFKEIETTCFCYLLSMVGLLVALTFLSNAYRFYLPVMIGLAIALNRVATQHMAANSLATPSPQAFAVR